MRISDWSSDVCSSDLLRPLRLDGTVRSVIHMGNDLRVISGGMSFPRDRFPDRRSLPQEFRDGLRKSGGIGAWMIAGGLYGSKGVVAAARREVRRRLAGPRRKLHFFDRGRRDLHGGRRRGAKSGGGGRKEEGR